MQAFDDYDLGEIARYIDWTPFFRTWELKGTFPKILDDPIVGATARSLYEDAQTMLERLIAERWVTARSVVGLWPAAGDGDDIRVYADPDRKLELATLHTLRQQLARDSEHPNLALADFVAPLDSGVHDHHRRLRRHSTGTTASTSGPRSSIASTTTTTRSSSPPSVTGWPKRLPSACMSACAASSGGTPPTSSSPRPS